MKRFTFIVLGVISFTATQPLAADAVHFEQVNPVMEAIAAAVVAADELVASARPKFDDKVCDLIAERLKYDLTGSLRNTPWFSGGTAEVASSLFLQVGDAEEKEKAYHVFRQALYHFKRVVQGWKE